VFVIDASVTLAWCFADELSETADVALGRLEREAAMAPAIWPLEVANGLRTAERRARLELTDLPRVRDLLLSLPVEVEPVDLRLALGEVAELARGLELSAYDAAYVALAARRGLSLATVDDRLRHAAASSGVELVA
jgi:predicted nucleic acid-binding protein